MSAARVVDGGRASSCWVMRLADQEKNFPTKAKAVAFLRALTKDTRVTAVCQRHDRGAYTYYGPGKDEHVVKATINRVSFASLRARAPKPLLDGLEAAHE